LTRPVEVPIRTTARRRIADEWALVLAAEGLTPRVWRTPDGYAVGVPEPDRTRAETALDAWERENPARPREHSPRSAEPAPAHPAALPTGLAIATALLGFFAHTGPRRPDVVWFAQGSADAEKILTGEPWRLITALSLHADAGHVMTNAVVGAFFITAVCRILGPGVGAGLVLLAGAGGNLINAAVYGSQHASVGASTAVFGAVGLLGGLGVSRWWRRGVRGRRVWIPVAAALGLLAMLGTAGERVDLWAHLWGLAVGAALGLPVGFRSTHPAGVGAQAMAGVATVAAVIGAWTLALR